MLYNFRLINHRAFTLTEIMVVVLIIGFLTQSAVFIYKKYLINAHRQQIKSVLLDNQKFLSSWYLFYGNFADKNEEWPNLPFKSVIKSLNIATPYYSIRFSSAKPDFYHDLNSYMLIAIPKCNTIQANDGCVCMDKNGNFLEHASSNCDNRLTKCKCDSIC